MFGKKTREAKTLAQLGTSTPVSFVLIERNPAIELSRLNAEANAKIDKRRIARGLSIRDGSRVLGEYKNEKEARVDGRKLAWLENDFGAYDPATEHLLPADILLVFVYADGSQMTVEGNFGPNDLADYYQRTGKVPASYDFLVTRRAADRLLTRSGRELRLDVNVNDATRLDLDDLAFERARKLAAQPNSYGVVDDETGELIEAVIGITAVYPDGSKVDLPDEILP